MIAEEVAKVNPDLVARDDKGEIYSVRYEAVNTMFLNEFLKEHLKVEEQEARLTVQKTIIGKQKKEFTVKLSEQQRAFETKLAQQQKQIEALAVGLQKVNERVEFGKSASQVVANEE